MPRKSLQQQSQYRYGLNSHSSPRLRMNNVRNFVQKLFSNAIEAAKDDHDPIKTDKLIDKPITPSFPDYLKPSYNQDNYLRPDFGKNGFRKQTSKQINYYQTNKNQLQNRLQHIKQSNNKMKCMAIQFIKQRKRQYKNEYNTKNDILREQSQNTFHKSSAQTIPYAQKYIFNRDQSLRYFRH